MGTEVSPSPVAWPFSPPPSAFSGLYCLATKTFQELAHFEANPKYFKQNQTQSSHCFKGLQRILKTTAANTSFVAFHANEQISTVLVLHAALVPHSLHGIGGPPAEGFKQD